MLYQSNAIKTLPKIIGIGFNYLKHNQEMGEGSLAPKAPVIFFKPWSSVTYLPKHVHLPSSKLHRVDHELELGVFISKEGRNIAKEDAFSHIGGYFIGIDFSDRNEQNDAKAKGLPWEFAKGQDEFCPISELISKDVNPYEIELQMMVNGQTKQQDFAKNMHFKIDWIINHVSKLVKLNEGDLILTGSPEGVSPVKSGDKLQAFGKCNGQVLAKLQFEVTA